MNQNAVLPSVSLSAISKKFGINVVNRKEALWAVCNNRLIVSSLKYMQGISFNRAGGIREKNGNTGKNSLRNNPSWRVCLLRETRTKSIIHGNQLNVWNSIHS